MYKLLKKELNILDEFWKFIEIFNYDNYKLSWIDGVYIYRKVLIKKIRETYSAEDFYKYEVILNKLLWNLLIKIKFDINDLLIQSKLYTEIKIRNSYSNKEYLHNEMKIRGSYSYTHKEYLHNEINDTKYYFTFYPQLINYDIVNKIFYIMSNRKLYYNVINGKKSIKNIEPIVYVNHQPYKSYYYPQDYVFPNINLIFYNQNKKETWINRINKLYFNNKNNNKIDSGWYNGSF